MAKPQIVVISCGGTISSLSEHSLEIIDYPEASRKMDADEALSRVQELGTLAELRPLQFRAVGSSAIAPADWLELARLIMRADNDQTNTTGFVILHGTGTLEETAYFLNLVLKIAKPVILVGAQRPANALSSDAPMNLVAAIRTAIHPEARGKGVLVVLNDEIHAAREVTKTSTYRLQTFRTPDFGVLGQVDGDRVCFYRAPLRHHTVQTAFDASKLNTLPRVDVVYSYAGSDGCAVDAFVAAGARGLVSAGFAPGIPAPAERRALEKAAAAGLLVVQSSRAGSGRISRRRYLRQMGMIAADNLNPEKARILLSLALTCTSDATTAQEFFDSY